MSTMAIFIAVHTWPWKIDHFRIGKFLAIGGLKELHPGNTALLVGFIRHDGNVVLCGTCDHACPAPGTLIQIYDHAVFVFSVVMCFFHDLPRLSLCYLNRCCPPHRLTAKGVLARMYNVIGIDAFSTDKFVIGGVPEAHG